MSVPPSDPNAPTQHQQHQQQSGYPYRPGPIQGNPFATLPLPGNAELLVYILALIVAAIVALGSDRVDSPFWMDFFKWTTAAYLISRGIAKASRVFEQ
ncbi:MAG: hypothetical protein QOK32_673 [Gaiellaceae bacterium]|jgi:hypothetical protein|nr:hypothetical protein [Gaiellaceae bacterium]